MRRLIPTVGLVFLTASGLALGQEAKPKASTSDKVFGVTNVLQIHLELSAKDLAGLEPVGGGFPFGQFGGSKKDPPKAADRPTDVHKGGSFGLEFPWVRGTLTADGRTYQDVGFRYKGGGSYVLGANRLKRNLKVDFDRHAPKQRFHGLKSINLNAGAMDPAGVRESLAFAVFRDAGIPTPRTAYAEVTLTVPGKFDREVVGTYTLVEEVDKDFLKRQFKSDKGLLMKPEVRPGFRGGPLGYQGDEWEPYKAALKPKDEPTKEQAARVIAFIKLVDRGTDDQFRREVGNYLDLDQFFRFLAVTTLLSNLDSFFTGGHNAYVYLEPKSNKLVFLPWDLDLAFGTFFLLGSPDQQADLSVMHPYAGEHKLVDRLLAVPELADRYKKVVRELTTTVFTKEKLAARLTELEKATREARARETKASTARKENTGFGFGFPGGQAQPPDLRAWVDKRLTSVNAQLEGKSKGTIPAGFGFGQPGGGRGGRIGELLPGPARDALRLTPEQRSKVDELQKAVDGQVEQLLTEEQRATLRRLREAGPKGPPGGFPGGPPPGKGFGPGGKG